MSREATKRLLDLLDQGVVTHEAVVEMCLNAMSEADVRDMVDANQLSKRFFEDESEEE
jgi:hypothetical protein